MRTGGREGRCQERQRPSVLSGSMEGGTWALMGPWALASHFLAEAELGALGLPAVPAAGHVPSAALVPARRNRGRGHEGTKDGTPRAQRNAGVLCQLANDPLAEEQGGALHEKQRRGRRGPLAFRFQPWPALSLTGRGHCRARASGACTTRIGGCAHTPATPTPPNPKPPPALRHTQQDRVRPGHHPPDKENSE